MTIARPDYLTVDATIGRTPLVRLQRIPGAAQAARGNVILGKLEGNNPAGSVKDRPALAMIVRAEARGRVLDQFANDDNWAAHYDTTGPEIWQDTAGQVTHFVSAMGTTGTITGVSRYLKECSKDVVIVGAQPTDGSSIPGIRKWPEAYVPGIRRHAIIDRTEEVTQADAEAMARRLAVEEGIFCGPSAAGACCIALRIAEEVEGATIVFIVCDRGDRYLSTGVFHA